MKSVIFSSYAHILPFVISENTVCDAITQEGTDVTLIIPDACTCNLSRPRSDSNAGSVCLACKANQRILSVTTTADEIINLDVLRSGSSFYKIRCALKDLQPSQLEDYFYKTLPVGRIALYDLVLKFKILEVGDHLSNKIVDTWKHLISVSCALADDLECVYQKHNFDNVIVYNSNYSFNHIAVEMAERLGMKTFSMHNSFSLAHTWDYLMFMPGRITRHRHACSKNWNNHLATVPLGKEQVALVGDHIAELFKGRNAHAYSSGVGSTDPSGVLRRIGACDRDYIMIAGTSSPDELYALEASGVWPKSEKHDFVFQNQIEWLKYLIEQASNNETVGLIIRVHPREFANKREGVDSDHGKKLRNLLEQLPDNVCVNWPEDNVSLYELLPFCDLALTCWSSIALEASFFGCPVVLPGNPIASYLPVADSICKDSESYWSTVLDYLAREWTIERAARSCRWLWTTQFACAVAVESREFRSCSAEEWLLRAFDWGSKVLFNGAPPYAVPSMAFSGSFKRLLERPIKPRGAAAIAATLRGEFDPMENFVELQQRQGLRDGFGGGPEAEQKELAAVYRQLSEFAEMLKLDASTCPRSKFLAMMHREGRVSGGEKLHSCGYDN